MEGEAAGVACKPGHKYGLPLPPRALSFTDSTNVGSQSHNWMAAPKTAETAFVEGSSCPRAVIFGIELAGADIPSVQFPHHCNLASIDIGNLRVNFV